VPVLFQQQPKTENRQFGGWHYRGRGSVYLYVLASSLLVTLLGLGALAAVRLEMRSTRLARDSAEARAYAVSAVELGLLQIKQNANWRTAWPNGTWLDSRPLGAGQFTLLGTDPVHTSLNDSPYDPLILTGIGTRGNARHKAQVTLVPVVKPLEALSLCLQASGQIQVTGGHQITLVGAPLATNGQLDNGGTIDGSAQAQSLNHTGTVTGTLTVPGPFRPMPDATVFTSYISKATAVPFASTIQNVVLAPGCNSLGPTDANGFYVIDTAGHDFTLRNSRIYGTLIIRAAGKNVTIDDAISMQNYRSDAPVLMVEGNLTIKPSSTTGVLSESACATNFNPIGAPYNGVTDTDQTDQYPDEIRGLVHVKGSLQLQQTARITGVVICEGTVTDGGTNTIIYDPSLYTNPPTGYTYVNGMKVSPGTWRQIVD
jgi:cytoskeletal protein CcmA (bactofilin family)